MLNSVNNITKSILFLYCVNTMTIYHNIISIFLTFIIIYMTSVIFSTLAIVSIAEPYVSKKNSNTKSNLNY